MSKITEIRGEQEINDVHIGVVVSMFNRQVTDRLLSGCLATLQQEGLDESNITVAQVPGAFEIPVTALHLASQGKFDAIIALGAVIRGETSHFDYICTECARGLNDVALETGLPVIFGVLTVENMQQALDRSGEEESNKGSEAARTALHMISVLAEINSD